MKAKISVTFNKLLVSGIPFVYLITFFFLPFIVVAQLSVTDLVAGQNPLFAWLNWEGMSLSMKLVFENYYLVFTDDFYADAYIASLKYAIINTVVCLLLGYPFAYAIAKSPASVRPALLMAVMLPFWTSLLIRVYAIRNLLDNFGIVNTLLVQVGLISEPLQMLQTEFSLIFGMAYVYLPFMVLPLYTSIVKLDARYLEAAYDLGCPPWKTFWVITVPLTKSGIIAGSLLVFIPSVGEFVVPKLIGPADELLIGNVIWDEFFTANNWPMASAITVIMLAIVIFPLLIFNRYQEK